MCRNFVKHLHNGVVNHKRASVDVELLFRSYNVGELIKIISGHIKEEIIKT